MKKLLLLLGLLASCSTFNRNTSNFYKSMAMVRIVQKDVGIVVGNGSAFVIAPNIMITANHVCNVITNPMYSGDVEYFYNGSFRDARITGILKRDTINDICAIKVEGVGMQLEPFKIAVTESLIGEVAYSYGCADGVFGFLSDGFVLDNNSMLPGKRVLVISAPAFFGQSGGPILNTDGEVIGLVSGGSNEFHHVQLSPPTSVLREFVKEYIK